MAPSDSLTIKKHDPTYQNQHIITIISCTAIMTNSQMGQNFVSQNLLGITKNPQGLFKTCLMNVLRHTMIDHKFVAYDVAYLEFVSASIECLRQLTCRWMQVRVPPVLTIMRS